MGVRELSVDMVWSLQEKAGQENRAMQLWKKLADHSKFHSFSVGLTRQV